MSVEKLIFVAGILWASGKVFFVAKYYWTLRNDFCCGEYFERRIMMFCRGDLWALCNDLCLQGICERYEAASNARPREAQRHRHQPGLQLDAQVRRWLPASRHGRCQENRIKCCFLSCIITTVIPLCPIQFVFRIHIRPAVSFGSETFISLSDQDPTKRFGPGSGSATLFRGL